MQVQDLLYSLLLSRRLKKSRGTTKPLPKATLQNINKHFEWSRQYREFDQLFEQMVK